jgi:hypothetical protein
MSTPAQREALYDQEAAKAQALKRGPYPICNLCDLPVTPGQRWHESHDPSRAKAFGGSLTGVAHKKCNEDHGHRIVTPAVAKAKRQARAHKGATYPGMGKHRLPCGRDSRLSKTLSGKVVRRLSQGQKLKLALDARRIG